MDNSFSINERWKLCSFLQASQALLSECSCLVKICEISYQLERRMKCQRPVLRTLRKGVYCEILHWLERGIKHFL